MANAAELLVGRSVGHQRAFSVAASGPFFMALDMDPRAVIRDAGSGGVELTPSQVYVETFRATRATLRLPAPAGRFSEWGPLCVAWFPHTPLFSKPRSYYFQQ